LQVRANEGSRSIARTDFKIAFNHEVLVKRMLSLSLSLLSGLALLAMSAASLAQDYPTKPIRMIMVNLSATPPV
jgi:hypothetical protein